MADVSDVPQDGESGVDFSTESFYTKAISNNEDNGVSIGSASRENVTITKSVSDGEQLIYDDSLDTATVFQTFVIIEIVMTALELIVWTVAAIRINRWKKNYRNQMLMQLSVVRFIKRLVFLISFLNKKGILANTSGVKIALLGFEIYIDFVIVILVFFFIKHMYDSLIVVLVKISEMNLWRVLTYAWLLPIPISVACTAIIVNGVLETWLMYLLVCCLFRWPLMLLGTILYLTILYRVLKDQIRKFARSLTIITFLLCLVINFYLFSKDVIELWCLKSFLTSLINYVSGFLMNFLILTFYIILIILNFKSKISESIPNYSISIDK